MNKFQKIIVLILALSTLLFSQEYGGNKGAEFCYQNKIKKDISRKLEITSPPPTHSFDVLDYKLDLDIYNCFISPYPKSFSALEIITIKADTLLNQIKLDASNYSLAVDAVDLAGVSYTHSSNVLNINLNRYYSKGEIFQVRIKYRHLNVSDGAFYVSNGFVFTDCEPEGARNWFPCWDKPYDKATLNLRAKTPATVKLGSNGRLADSVKTGDTIYYNWISRDPIATYLIVISARVNYNLDIIYWTRPSTQEIIPIRFYYNPGESVTSIKPKVMQMINRYSNLFGEHPFEKNGFATLNSQFAWGGMENQTLTSLCPNCWGENLISHEFAHQWFGDMITCATWADIWLNEGFATYCEALWYEYTGGYSSYKNDILGDASSYFSGNPGWAISNPQWAIVTPDVNTLFNYSITYAKGACVLHMLRYVLGDSTFFKVLKTYGTDTLRFRHKAATIRDFANLVSEIAQQDMNWFFDEWIYTPNHPVYQNTYSISSTAPGRWAVAFTARQTQTNTGFFKMPLTLKINFVDGTDTLVRVFNNSNNQVFSFLFSKQPTSLVFDPNNDIVLKQGTTTQTTTICKEVHLNEGWNLISVPLNSNTYSPANIFPDAISPAYSYSGGYYVSDSLIPGRGYWLKFPSNQLSVICGNAITTNSLNLKTGWNLIGVFDKNVNVSSITSSPSGIIETPFYGFESGYFAASTLQVGKGYWVKVSQNGTIYYNTLNNKSDVPELIYNNNCIKINIVDAEGFSKILYLYDKNQPVKSYELPPIPPAGIKDIRFVNNLETGFMSEEQIIQFNSIKFPVKIFVEGDRQISLLFKNEITSEMYDLNNGDSLLIEKNINVLKVAGVNYPDNFRIYQNFPNPFNSTTTIQYTLPSSGRITLSVYNFLGERVKIVLDEFQNEGFHKQQISFNELSSGIYFVELKYNSISKLIKCMLLK